MFLLEFILKIMNYKINILNYSYYSNKNNKNLHQIFLTNDIFPISRGGLNKGFYGNSKLKSKECLFKTC